MRVILGCILPIVLTTQAWASHWKYADWTEVAISAQIPEPFGAIRLTLKTIDEGTLQEITLRVNATDILVPPAMFEGKRSMNHALPALA